MERLKKIRRGNGLYTRKIIDKLYSSGSDGILLAAEGNHAVFTRSYKRGGAPLMQTASDNLRNCLSLTMMADAPHVIDGKPVRRGQRQKAVITMHIHPTEVASAEGYKGPVYELYRDRQPAIIAHSADFYRLPKAEQRKQIAEWKGNLSRSFDAPLLPLRAEDTIRVAADFLKSELGEGTKIKTVLVPGQHTLNAKKGTYPESLFAFERTSAALQKLKQEGIVNNVKIKGLHGSIRGSIATVQQGHRVYRVEPVAKGGETPERHERMLRQELEKNGIEPNKAYKPRMAETKRQWPWSHSSE